MSLAEFHAIKRQAKAAGIATSGKTQAQIVELMAQAGVAPKEHDTTEAEIEAQGFRAEIAAIAASREPVADVVIGGPKEVLTEVPKKGNPSWSPATRLDVRNRRAGFRYRWCDKDPANIEKKLAEGWVFVNKTSGLPGELERRDQPHDGSDLTTTKTYRELVLMALPEDIGLARDRYVADQTRKQTVGLKADAERTNRSAGQGIPTAQPLHGTIVIS